MDIEKRLEKIEGSLESLKQRREWMISALAAAIAAFASIVAAGISYKSSEQAEMIKQQVENRKIEQAAELAGIEAALEQQGINLKNYQVQLDAYREFGNHIIIAEDKKVRCRALIVLSALGGETLTPAQTLLAEKINCDNDEVEAVNNISQTRSEWRIRSKTEFIGKNCENGRATFTTMRKLLRQELKDSADEHCSNKLTIPSGYIGPHDDGSVSFETSASIDGYPIWCNCHPKS